jgi:hypothetical protein
MDVKLFIIFYPFCIANISTKMLGNTCQYINCGKLSSRPPNLKFYRFPKDDTLSIWKINAGTYSKTSYYKCKNVKIKTKIISTIPGNIKLLSLNDNKLHSRYLCQEHLSTDSFMNMTCKKLTPLAIPYNFNDINDQPTSSSEYIVNNYYYYSYLTN